MNWWGGPPGPRGTPSSRRCVKNQSAATTEKPTRGSAADEGVRPTISATARKREKYVALGLQPASACGGLQSTFRKGMAEALCRLNEVCPTHTTAPASIGWMRQ
jgi:hypothetical protein